MASAFQTKIDSIKSTFKTAKNNTVSYFKGVRTEWGKITWPEKRSVVNETIFVVAIVFVFTVFIYIVDKIFEWILSKIC